MSGDAVHITPNGDLTHPPAGFLVPFYVATIVMTLAAWLAWIVIQVPTYRHADGERRQQLKWLYSGAAVTLVAFVFSVFVIPVAMGQAPGWGNNPVITVLIIVAFGALPASLAVAVLRYRLYELDRIISRVVSYTLITAVLVGFYTGLVLLTTHVLPFKSAVPVAASTLITAALFNPLRRRVQRAVDRRFNRSRYNAEAVVAAFTARMRQTVEFNVVRDNLVGVVHEAFQPTQVSMWLAEAGSGHDTGSVAVDRRPSIRWAAGTWRPASSASATPCASRPGSGRLPSRRCSRTCGESGSPGRLGRWAAMVKGGTCSSTRPGRWPWTSRGWTRRGCTGWGG